MRFIGDVHGKFRQYKRLIADVPASVQVGDMGVGFRYYSGPRDGEFYANPPYDAMVPGHRFIRGNHDNPAACRRHSQHIADGTVEGDTMFVGGALSIDRQYRHENYDWWANEELSTAELSRMVDVYAVTRPRLMVTHDAPESVALALNGSLLNPRFASRTRRAFQSMFELHQPEMWIFGHWHVSWRQVIEGTRFVCLAELEAMDVDFS